MHPVSRSYRNLEIQSGPMAPFAVHKHNLDHTDMQGLALCRQSLIPRNAAHSIVSRKPELTTITKLRES